jgi:hypothetical protein
MVGSLFTLIVRDPAYGPASSEPVVALRVKSYQSWCRNDQYFIQIMGHDGTMVQFMPVADTDAGEDGSGEDGLDEDAGGGGKGGSGGSDDGDGVQLEFIRWKNVLSAAASLHILDEKRWYLRSSTLPRPWEAMGDPGGGCFRAKLNGVTPVAVKHFRIAEPAAPSVADQDLYSRFLNETIISCTTQG